MDGYYPFQVRSLEGGGLQDGGGPGSTADATREPASSSFATTFSMVMIVVMYFVAMFFFGLIYYTGIKIDPLN